MAVVISLGDFCICLKQKLCDFPLDFQDSAKNNEVLTSSEKKKDKKYLFTVSEGVYSGIFQRSFVNFKSARGCKI